MAAQRNRRRCAALNADSSGLSVLIVLISSEKNGVAKKFASA
jgi:hypothetical protein